MRIPHAALPAIRTVVVLIFAALAASIFGFFWVKAGGKIPLITTAGYRAEVTLPDVDNLVYQSDVTMNGVNVGKIEGIDVRGSDAYVVMDIDPEAAPLHEGVTVTVRNKTLIEETYLDIIDGAGEPLPDGVVLPKPAGQTSVQFDDVLRSLDAPTRKSLSSTLQSAGLATDGSREGVAQSVEGLGYLGREGGDALSALAAQSEDLSKVAANTTALLEALDTGQGQITQLVRDADALTESVAAGREDVEALMRELPPTLETAHEASVSLEELAGSLAPVAANLAAAGPDVSAALEELPATSADLRGLLPSLDQTLDRAPATLDRVPDFSQELRPLFSTLQVNLADLNPMLAYLEPYGPEISTFFTSFGQALAGSDANGKILRVMPVLNEKTPNQPTDTQFGPLTKHNPYPTPGASRDPGSFEGEYPRIEEEGPTPR